jgi:hypothetical protein
MEWVVNPTFRPFSPWKRAVISIVQGAEWVTRLVRVGVENLAPRRDSNLDRSASSRYTDYAFPAAVVFVCACDRQKKRTVYEAGDVLYVTCVCPTVEAAELKGCCCV